MFRWAAVTTIGLLLALLVVGVASVYCRPAPKVDILGGETFSGSELSTMEEAFAEAGLGDYAVEHGRIRVPRGKKASYIAALASGDALPAQFGSYLDEAFANQPASESGAEREHQIRAAKQKELALIIRSLKGIERAAVLCDERTKPGMTGETITTASVSVAPDAGTPLAEKVVTAIRQIVSAAFAGLSPQDVAVCDLATGRVFFSADTLPPDAMAERPDDPLVGTSCSVTLLGETVHDGIVDRVTDGWLVLRRAEEDGEVWISREKILYVATRIEGPTAQTPPGPSGR